ncbi:MULTISPECIES: single-stranded-DNA-specific exonuclease RecJ [Moraxella]|uniref:Single-stranded-DNA-specific exonuclease RecJ n=1 Tax=Moraxella catarrhalis TaxID=480 RepID=A0A7Z0UXN9_MORCA|nr:single-stranded-DNA-specific exonuclease RecJ [Moraxella catarrhalis]OAV00106.1 Single-stranded-DNA-specific exonuclease RecJ [Moraxella catarrhalis]STY81222.1 Single-stranded-DNA-specific exonuclease recJ [Moraxella catarrhalis]
MAHLNLTPRLTEPVDGQLYHQVGSLALARVLQARGVHDFSQMDTDISQLLAAADLMGIDDAIALIDEAIDRRDQILIIGDFDCDGATSTALMVRVLRQMGALVDFLVPDRFKFGYGLTPQIVEHGAALYRPNLIITVDNGISSHDGVATAHQMGIKVVITDHHLTTKPSPPADAVVNPNQLGCDFDSKWLVGVGVAFYVMGRLAKHRRQLGKMSASVAQYLDLVALGTVADLGVLDKNNRILVTHGLNRIRQGQCVIGILAILEQAGRQAQMITSEDFGFAIAPRINAAGRMDNMRIGVECLLTDDWGEAHRLAIELNKLNYARRSVEMTMKDDAVAIIESLPLFEDAPPRGVVLYQDDWHQGVIGIVAGRLKEKLYRPSIVFAPADPDALGDENDIKGSARSIAGVHIRDVIESVAVAHPGLIKHFGGHAMAAGLTLKKANFERFAQAFQDELAGFDEALFYEEKFTDGALLPEEFSLNFADKLKSISVWGNGFVPPVFDGEFEVINQRILKDKHLKLTLKMAGVQYPIDAIWFNYRADDWDYRAFGVHILYTLDINEWQGSQSLQLIIKDLAVISTAALMG